MKKEQISAFTNRITQSNKSELICVLYDIFFTYMDEAKEADIIEAKVSFRHASQVLEHLKNALDFKYEISSQLYPIYDYCERVLARAMYMGWTKDMDTVLSIMGELKEAFEQVAKEDDSESMMQNTQKVTAGFTYGRNDLVESSLGDDPSRGFLA